MTSDSDWCVPGSTKTFSLKRLGKDRINLTRILSPIKVAMEQCGIVGLFIVREKRAQKYTVELEAGREREREILLYLRESDSDRRQWSSLGVI